MGIFGIAHGCERFPPKSLSHKSYNNETWHSYTLPKENLKIYKNHVTHSLSSADISIFSPVISNFSYIKFYSYNTIS